MVVIRSKQVLLALTLLVGMLAKAVGSEIKLYGLIDSGVAYQRIHLPETPIPRDGIDGFDGSEFGIRSGQQASSRWGIRGTERLDGTNQVEFRLEKGIFAGSGDTSGKLRISTLSWINDDLGKVVIGRRNNASSSVLDDIDPMGGSYDTASWQSSMGSASIRYSNQVLFESRKMAGFMFAASYAFDIDNNVFYIVDNRPANAAQLRTRRELIFDHKQEQGAIARCTVTKMDQCCWLVLMTRYFQMPEPLMPFPKVAPKPGSWVEPMTFLS